MRWVAPQEVLEHHLVVEGGHPLVWRRWHQHPKKPQQIVALNVGQSAKTDVASQKNVAAFENHRAGFEIYTRMHTCLPYSRILRCWRKYRHICRRKVPLLGTPTNQPTNTHTHARTHAHRHTHNDPAPHT